MAAVAVVPVLLVLRQVVVAPGEPTRQEVREPPPLVVRDILAERRALVAAEVMLLGPVAAETEFQALLALNLKVASTHQAVGVVVAFRQPPQLLLGVRVMLIQHQTPSLRVVRAALRER